MDKPTKPFPTDDSITRDWIDSLRMMVEALVSLGYPVSREQVAAAIKYSSSMPNKCAESGSDRDMSIIRYHSAMDFISGWDSAMLSITSQVLAMHGRDKDVTH